MLGVTDEGQAARFWREALGYEIRDDGFGGWATVLVPPGRSGVGIALQGSRTPIQQHPRLHLDLHVADGEEQMAEVKRLVSLGAVIVDWDSYPPDPDFVVLADPDGNRFCVVDLSHESALCSTGGSSPCRPQRGKSGYCRSAADQDASFRLRA